MKKINSLLALGILGATLMVKSVETFAASPMAMAVEEVDNNVLEVTYNSNSGIYGASYTGTLADGSVLGFYMYSSRVYFCGAVSSATSLSVPGKISYNGTEYTVNYCGYDSYRNTLDLNNAGSVTSLTLPAGIAYIYNYIPSTIADLHLKSETPPSMDGNYISESTTVWVPQSAYPEYQSLTVNSNSRWYGVEVRYEGWEPQSVTVNVATPGTFASELLKIISQWSDINELIVIGSLNTEEMELFSRLSQLERLDLSQTNITTVTGCHDLARLKTVLLPSTVTEIGSGAFNGCTRLSSINTPNVVLVGDAAFSGCDALKTVSLPQAVNVESGAFSNSGLTSISLPLAKSIGDRAFSGCESLVNVDIPEAEYLGSSVFSHSAISEISLPKATYIGGYCFNYCSSLETVTLADEGLEVIPYYCFEYCNNLTTIGFPLSLKAIETYAFEGTGITTAILPEGLQSIGRNAFRGCPLNTISIPSTIQDIDNNAFEYCRNIKDVYCYAVAPPATAAFTASKIGSATLHVPSFSLTNYILDENWYRFYQTVAIEGNLSDLAINQTFTISTYDGLDDKVNLNLTWNGHLTVSAGSAFNIGTFTQDQSTMINDYYYDDWGYRVYRGISTLIANNEMSADNVSLRLQVRTERWNFISFPFDVNVADIEYPEGTLWVIRRYSGADRAALTGNTWQNMTNGMTLQAGEGYILHCAKENTEMAEFVFHPVNNANKNGLFAHQDVVKPLNTYASEHAHNRSWNLVGNPYPAYFDTHSIEHNGVITVYNNDYYYYGEGSYTAYSLLDDDYVLRPHEAFFVQCPVDATSMTFKANGRQHEAGDNYGYYSRSQETRVTAYTDRLVYNFTLTRGDFTDRARLVINPQAKMDYEISCDASKFMSDNPQVPQLYIYDNGIRYAIDERPLGDGIFHIGTRFGQAGSYTLQLMNNPADDIDVILKDNEAGNEINLAQEAYTFTAQAGTAESRFTLTIGGETTDINGIGDTPSAKDNSVYDLQGRKANMQSQKGVFIVKQNGISRKVVK